MKVLVFNVKYSDNLGDGILAQCLERELAHEAIAEVETIDLAGRKNFGTTSGHRQQAIQLLHVLPPLARKTVVGLVLKSKLDNLRKEWDQKIANADAIVIGGGNLFQDDDLNFPLKVGTLMDCVSRSQKPLAIYAVGVSQTWSETACNLFGRFKDTRLAYLSVRDSIAAKNWRQHFADGQMPDIVADPGLLAQQLMPFAAGTGTIKHVAGICITDPLILQRHADKPSQGIPFTTVKEYLELIQQLVGHGYHVRLFTNGAREDQSFAQRIFDNDALIPFRLAKVLELAERPRRPQDLLCILQSTSVILAHRLHACIAAYSCNIPHVGLGWDHKVKSFFLSVKREAYFVEACNALPSRIASLLMTAEETGIDEEQHRAAIQAATTSILRMRKNLSQSCASTGSEAQRIQIAFERKMIGLDRAGFAEGSGS